MSLPGNGMTMEEGNFSAIIYTIQYKTKMQMKHPRERKKNIN
jgi:hypothetical protein